MLFPGPDVLAGADLAGLGLTTARQRTLHALAAAAASGRLTFDPGTDPAEIAARLAELPGIGPWTTGYILMRAAGDPDAFPAADLGLRRALARLGVPARAPGQVAPVARVRRHAALVMAGRAGRDLASQPDLLAPAS